MRGTQHLPNNWWRWGLFLSWPGTTILLIWASQVVRITGMSHLAPNLLVLKIQINSRPLCSWSLVSGFFCLACFLGGQGDTGVWTQGLMLARQASSHQSFFYDEFFLDRVWWMTSLGLALNHDPTDLCVLSNWDYRREPPRPGLACFWSSFTLLYVGAVCSSLAEQNSIVWVCHNLFILLLINICFQLGLLGINIHVQTFVWTHAPFFWTSPQVWNCWVRK
jgi:hypothetical protein